MLGSEQTKKINLCKNLKIDQANDKIVIYLS